MKFTEEELKEVLYKHNLWYLGKKGGERADLRSANLGSADLRYADLRYADLYGANLYGADLGDANLRDAKYPLCCPDCGAFVAFKKARYKNGECIVKLQVPEDARRSSATSRKCRCDKAIVLAIETLDGKPIDAVAFSSYNNDFAYEVGQTVCVDDFCDDRWRECAPGIHFFITRKEAVDY